MPERSGNIVLLTSLFLVLLAFAFPVGLYPYQDMFRDVLTFASGLLILCHILWAGRFKRSVPGFILFVPVFCLGLALNYLMTSPNVLFSYYWHFLAFGLAGAVAISVASLAETWTKETVVRYLAVFLIAVFCFSALFGLMRYYGILGYFVPLITDEGTRLIGPMGQPNLMAVLTALALGAIFYLRNRGLLSSTRGFIGLAVLAFYVGSLTGSRTWYVTAIVALWPSIAAVFRFGKLKLINRELSRNGQKTRSALIIVALFVIVSLLAPKIDALIADSLKEIGFIERINASEMYENRSLIGSSGRLDEWKNALSGITTMEHPWFGYGVGRYGVFSNELKLNDLTVSNGSIWLNAHNVFLNFMVEWGLSGVLILLVFVGYLLSLITKVQPSSENVFLVCVLLILMLHNLVEFSLWHMPFLAIFIAAFTLLDNRHSFDFSNHWIRRVIVLSVLFVFLPFGAYVAKDMMVVTQVMYKKQPDFMDQTALRDASRSAVVGNGALSVLILRFDPPALGVGPELNFIESVVNWRPEPLFLLRKATLLAASGESERACEAIKRVTRLYPYSVNTVLDELTYLSVKSDVKPEDYIKCIAAERQQEIN
jgi:hypothetical protein